MTPIVRIFAVATAFVAAAAVMTAPLDGLAASNSAAGAVLSVAPAHPDPSVAVGKSYFVHTVQPGATWTESIAVTNTYGVRINAWVDAVDGITSIRTGAVYTARTAAPLGTAAWVRPSVSSISVAPRGRTVISFTVSVPADAGAGDHVAGIAFEDMQGSTSGQAGASSASGGITTVLRSVVAIQVRVPGPALFLLHVYGASVHPVVATGGLGISIDMADVGGLLGKPLLDIALDGPGGYHRDQTFQLDTMLPGDRITDELLWPGGLAPGDYRLSITEDGSGRQGVTFVASDHLAAALRPSTPIQVRPGIVAGASSSGGPGWVVVVAAGAGASVLIVVGLFAAVGRRRRCLHCNRSLRGRRLVTVDRLDEIGGCMRCAVVLHNAGAGRFCRECLRSHLPPNARGGARTRSAA
jgi:hypothetical protein